MAKTHRRACSVAARSAERQLQHFQADVSGDDKRVQASAAPLRLEGGRSRVVFRLAIELQKLEATFNYESADVAPLASLSVQARSCALSCKARNPRVCECSILHAGPNHLGVACCWSNQAGYLAITFSVLQSPLTRPTLFRRAGHGI